VKVERVDGGLTNELYRVERGDGEVVAVKLFRGDGFEVELACLERVRGIVPAPEAIVRAPRALAYRWIDGITLNELRRTDAAGFASLAGSLGKLLARLATVAPDGLPPPPPPIDWTIARARLGALADALECVVPPAPPSSCLVHGDLSGRNILVGFAGRWRLAGVIDWERAHAGSPLDDIGHLLRYRKRFDAAFRDEFARGYRAGRGELADSWWHDARLADARTIVGELAGPRELAPDFADELRRLLGRLVSDLQVR
jgi:aminoglycoside phosphotransferase (APT) family kinase protein